MQRTADLFINPYGSFRCSLFFITINKNVSANCYGQGCRFWRFMGKLQSKEIKSWPMSVSKTKATVFQIECQIGSIVCVCIYYLRIYKSNPYQECIIVMLQIHTNFNATSSSMVPIQPACNNLSVCLIVRLIRFYIWFTQKYFAGYS